MDRAIDWLEPANWEELDRELCSLMDRVDEEVKLEVTFADAALLDGDEVDSAGCEEENDPGMVLLNGVKMRGGTVKVQLVGKLK